MRWEAPKEIKEGDRKVVTKFALFPVICRGQYVWLERYDVEYEAVVNPGRDEWFPDFIEWRRVR